MNQTEFLNRYGPWAVVTGASDGIGRAFAIQLGGKGINIVLVARREDRLNHLASELRTANGVETRVIVADLATASGRRQVDEGSRDLDVGLLVAAAGFGTSGDFLAADIDQERDMLEVNCSASLHQSHEFGRRFAQRGRGGIILMSSILSWQGVPRSANYAATKAYVQSLAEGLRIELAPQGVDVLSSAPGPVASGFADRANMRMGAALDADFVAQSSLDALGNKGTVIPGALSKLLTYSLLPLPRAWRTRILARVMAGMTAHQVAAPAYR